MNNNTPIDPCERWRFRSALSVALALLLVGCISLKQSEFAGGERWDHLSYNDDCHCAILQVGPSNVPKSRAIVDAESYAIAPTGTRFGLSSRPHPYDRRPESPVPYVRDDVFLVDSRGRIVDRVWQNGRWKLHFELDGPDGRETRDFELRLSTTGYNPLVDGPPN